MNKNLEHLLSIASNPASPNSAEGKTSQLLAQQGERGQELMGLLVHRNGFYAFESALLVRPLDFHASPVGLSQWNNVALWKAEYKVDLSGFVFFAEDIFGVQFCLKDNEVNSFDPETGELAVIAQNLEDWARWVLEDSKARTGWPLAHLWQQRKGALKLGTRLLPKVPFVLGGQFAVENLYALDETEGMRFRASIANQIHDSPDGSHVVLDIKRSD
jgi:hypothetical protein